MPQDTGRIKDVGNTQTPRLHSRRNRVLNAESFCEIQGLDLFPPRIEIDDYQLHHVIASEAIHFKFLYKYLEATDCEQRKRLSEPCRSEAEATVEVQTRIDVACWDEWPYSDDFQLLAP